MLSQIVRLSKSLLLRPDGRPDQPFAQFMAGRQDPIGFLGGFGLTWWYSDQTFQAIESVSRLVIGSSAAFRECDIDSVKGVVTDTMQELCAEKALFDVDAVILARRRSLFDCCRVPALQYAEAVLGTMQARLAAQIGQRCTLFAVPRVISPSFSISSEGLHFVSVDDVTAWQTLIEGGYQFDGWSSSSPKLGTGREFSPPADFTGILASEGKGTPKGARFSSILKFRKLLAVLVAMVSVRLNRTYRPSAARPFEFCMQFPHASAVEGRAVRQDCGPLLPYYVSDIVVTAEDVQRIHTWYGDCERAAAGSRDRIDKAAHFLNRAMNADDIEAYTNYFVALDALFGQRGSVEASILRGVRELQLGQSYVDKASRLFDFRNEIVHGSSRFVSECPGYERYVDHFKEDPVHDLQRLAQLAVIGAASLTANQWVEIASGGRVGALAQRRSRSPLAGPDVGSSLG